MFLSVIDDLNFSEKYGSIIAHVHRVLDKQK